MLFKNAIIITLYKSGSKNIVTTMNPLLQFYQLLEVAIKFIYSYVYLYIIIIIVKTC